MLVSAACMAVGVAMQRCDRAEVPGQHPQMLTSHLTSLAGTNRGHPIVIKALAVGGEQVVDAGEMEEAAQRLARLQVGWSTLWLASKRGPWFFCVPAV